MLVMDRTYDFTNGTNIPHITYWIYAQMDVRFC